MIIKNLIDRAIEEAKRAQTKGEVPVGAALIDPDGKIWGAGNTKETAFDPSGHAEIDLLRKVALEKKNWRLKDCEIFVTLEPCPMCLGAIQHARIGKLSYGAKDQKGGALSLGYSLNEDERTNHRFEVEYFPVSECEQLLKEFFRQKRKSSVE